MVKKKLGGARNRKHVTSAAVKKPVTQIQDGPEQPAHVKKKLSKKVQFLERVADSKKSALAARAGVKKKSHKQKRRKPLPDLASLADILAEVSQQPSQQIQQQEDSKHQNKQRGRTEQISTSKARRIVTQLETDRMQQVLAHPQYMANPLAAIRNHLEATLPAAAPAKPPQHSKLSKAQQRRRKQANADMVQD